MLWKSPRLSYHVGASCLGQTLINLLVLGAESRSSSLPWIHAGSLLGCYAHLGAWGRYRWWCALESCNIYKSVRQADSWLVCTSLLSWIWQLRWRSSGSFGTSPVSSSASTYEPEPSMFTSSNWSTFLPIQGRLDMGAFCRGYPCGLISVHLESIYPAHA